MRTIEIIAQSIVGIAFGLVLAALGVIGFWAVVVIFVLIGLMFCIFLSLMIVGLALMAGVTAVRSPATIKVTLDEYSRRVKEGTANAK